MRRAKRRNGLSELEGATLGVVWSQQPCTPYTIRMVFQSSPSPYWSGSAGAIYPLVARLEKHGYLRAVETMTGRRRGRLYSITPAGLRAARAWIGPPLFHWVIGVPVDPLRTRVRFLGALTPARRARFLDDAIKLIGTEIKVLEADHRSRRKDPDPFSHLIGLGAIRMLRAREEWLRSVRIAVGRSRSRPRKGEGVHRILRASPLPAK